MPPVQSLFLAIPLIVAFTVVSSYVLVPWAYVAGATSDLLEYMSTLVHAKRLAFVSTRFLGRPCVWMCFYNDAARYNLEKTVAEQGGTPFEAEFPTSLSVFGGDDSYQVQQTQLVHPVRRDTVLPVGGGNSQY